MLMVAPCNSMTGDHLRSDRTTQYRACFSRQPTLPHLNVADNVAYGLRRKGIRRSECDVRVSEVLQLVGLGVSADAPSANFQGGGETDRSRPITRSGATNCCCSTNLSPDSMTLSTTACFTTSSMCSPPLKQPRAGSPTIEEAERAGTQLLRIHDGVVSPELTESSQWHVQVVSAADTFGLRRRVLRDGTRTTDVNFTVMRPQFRRSQTLQAGRSLRSRVGFNGIVNIRPSTVYNFEGWQAIELSRARRSTGPSAVRHRVGSKSVR